MTKDVVSGANSSKDPNGPVQIDRRIPQLSPKLKDDQGDPVNLWNLLQIHERVEGDETRKWEAEFKQEHGRDPTKEEADKFYRDVAHPHATAAEREAARQWGIDFDAYTKEIDGYLSHIEHEKVENPPTDTHIDPQEAIGHHRSTNKQRMMTSVPAASAFEKSGMIDNAEAYQAAAKKRREQGGGSSAIKVFTSAEAQARYNGTTVKEENAKRAALVAEHGPRFDEAMKADGVEAADIPKNVRQAAIQAMASLHMEPGEALDYAVLKDEHEARLYEDEQTRLIEQGIIRNEEGHAADVGEIPFAAGEHAPGLGEDIEGRGAQEAAATGEPARYAGARYPEEVEFFQTRSDEDDKLLEGMPEAAVFGEGRGVLGRGKYYVELDGQMLGNLQPSKEAAVIEAKRELARREENNRQKAEVAERRKQIVDRVSKGGEVTESDLKFMGLKPGGSDLRWFIPAAADLFGVSSRAIRPFIADMVKVGYSDMGAKREYVAPAKAIVAIARGRAPQLELPAAEPGAEGKPQLVIPGADRISQAEQVQRRANAPLKPGVAQKPADEGLFSDEGKQQEFFQQQLGQITFREGMKPIMELASKADPSTFIHESGHLFLELMSKWSEHPQAPEAFKADMGMTLDWLGLKSMEQLRETTPSGRPTARARAAHEKFATGFEQYLREGTAPSVQPPTFLPSSEIGCCASIKL